MHTYIYIHTYIHTNIQTNKQTYIHTPIHPDTQTPILVQELWWMHYVEHWCYGCLGNASKTNSWTWWYNRASWRVDGWTAWEATSSYNLIKFPPQNKLRIYKCHQYMWIDHIHHKRIGHDDFTPSWRVDGTFIISIDQVHTYIYIYIHTYIYIYIYCVFF